jgi:hypothetical protein
MLMSNCESGDQYGVNYNFNYVLLQIRETTDDFEEARIKLTLKDVDAVIEALNHFKNRVTLWKDAVGLKKDEESEVEYMTRVIQTARDNNYFTGRQEE